MKDEYTNVSKAFQVKSIFIALCIAMKWPILISLILLPVLLFGQEDTKPMKSTLSGYIKDKNGEVLIGANIYVEELETGTSTNNYGFYSLSLNHASYHITWSFIGYKSQTIIVEIHDNLVLNIELVAQAEELGTVRIESDRPSQLRMLRMSSMQISPETISKIPSLAGEADLIKAIELLPGIQPAGEGLSNFVVRGGNYDQNLIILDEAIVYNPSHLLGFFSIFNPDVIKSAKIYKGDFPAKFGGRLSSLLEVNMKDGNNSHFSGSGGIGTVASRITLEIPIFNKKGSVLISGRRSYIDIYLPLSKDEDVKNNNIYFYDSYLKANYQINKKNKIFISSYFGRDLFKYRNEYYVNWGNITGTLRWNHLFSPRMFSNLSIVYSRYDYRLGQTADLTGVEWNSSLSDIRLKYDFTWYLNPKNTVKFGLSSSYNSFEPGYIIAGSEASVFNDFSIPSAHTFEHSIYMSNEQKIGSLLALSYGLRGSLFQNVGEATIYNFNENFEKVDSSYYPKGELFNSYWGFEPRLGLKIILSSKSALKASYSHTIQYLHLISNTSTGTPLDVWIPSDPNIKPQKADQYALGFFRSILHDKMEFSCELYYKKMKNQIDYKNHADLILNPELTGELRFGEMESYGIEFLFQKTTGKWQGMASYTLAKTNKLFSDINSGRAFPAGYDRRHDLSLLCSYEAGSRWRFSATWVYQSSPPLTLPLGRYIFGNVVLPQYSERNAYRLYAYHRLDLSATLKSKQRTDRKIHGELNFSIYNVYNRKNPWFIYFQADDDQPLVTEAYKLYLFPIIPSVSYNFKF